LRGAARCMDRINTENRLEGWEWSYQGVE
jgi:hypothetical protein